jgi:hypothetical protein
MYVIRENAPHWRTAEQQEAATEAPTTLHQASAISAGDITAYARMRTSPPEEDGSWWPMRSDAIFVLLIITHLATHHRLSHDVAKNESIKPRK